MNVNKSTKTLNNSSAFSVSDLTLAATLSLSIPLVSIDRTDPHRALFVFRRDAELEDFVDRYWRNEVRVEPQALANQIKNLKVRINSGE